ncbi:zinc-ribbon domain-containing protein [Roseovarius tibetensis]|uniref:zinc-ribbon domain-containing protein n=1 Tax=Roseovarius tibetensis TaxID=2685897 RepID=UPI003D7F7299
MRLTCPNCGAQYEVPAAAIPAAGRTVQCSACGEAWEQRPTDPAPQPKAPPPQETAPPGTRPDRDTPPTRTAQAPEDHDDATDPDTDGTPPPATDPAQRRLDPEVADILRAEAARERAVRAAEATGSVGPHGDLAQPQAAAPTPRAEAGPAPRSDPMPDTDEIRSSLTLTRKGGSTGPTDPRQSRGGGFRVGIWVAVIAFALATGAYLAAPDIVDLAPATEGPVTRYVTAIDEARRGLDALINRVVAQLGQI